MEQNISAVSSLSCFDTYRTDNPLSGLSADASDFATYLSLATAPPIFAWMSDLLPHDAEQRAFILGFSIAFYYAVGAWSNVLIWPASEVPHYRVAWQTSIALWVLVIIELCVLRWLEIKYIRCVSFVRRQLYSVLSVGYSF